MDRQNITVFSIRETGILLKQTVFFVSFLFAATTFHAQIAQSSPQQPLMNNTPPAPNKLSNAKLTFKVIDAPNKTFGYDIYAGQRKMIHQPSIPCLPGNEGFKTREVAAKVAKLAMNKIRNGETLPTITVEELKNLKAI